MTIKLLLSGIKQHHGLALHWVQTKFYIFFFFFFHIYIWRFLPLSTKPGMSQLRRYFRNRYYPSGLFWAARGTDWKPAHPRRLSEAGPGSWPMSVFFCSVFTGHFPANWEEEKPPPCFRVCSGVILPGCIGGYSQCVLLLKTASGIIPVDSEKFFWMFAQSKIKWWHRCRLQGSEPHQENKINWRHGNKGDIKQKNCTKLHLNTCLNRGDWKIKSIIKSLRCNQEVTG